MKKIIIASLAVMPFAFFFLAALWPNEYARVTSPDGEHFAVARYHAYESWVPRSPGSSGDKEGWIVIFRKDGGEIGRANVEMLRMIDDIRWSPTTAEIKLVAAWEL